jgi:hypothetical protein
MTRRRIGRAGSAHRRGRRLLAFVVVIGALTAGCGVFGGDGGNSTEGATSGVSGAATGGPCPANLVSQTDRFPEVEHGGVNQLIGRHGQADKATMRYSGPLQDRYRGAHGVQTVEIRAGGAAIGNATVLERMRADDGIYLGFVNTDDAIAARSTGTSVVGVASTLDLSPQMLMWSPGRYSIARFEDLAKSRAKVLYFPGSTYIDFLVSRGYLTVDQLDASYDGSPQRWLASNGSVIQQGFATNEVYTYENDLTGWKKEVDFFLIHWFGYENYPAMLSVRADRLEASRACLSALVPVLQRAWVDFLNDPSDVNRTIVDVLGTYDTFFKVSEKLNEDAERKFQQYKIASNGSDDVFGNFDLDRVERFIPIVADIYRKRGAQLPGTMAGDIVTNDFIDPSISWKAK